MQTLTLNQADRSRNDKREFIFIGCTPNDEICTMAGYEAQALKNGQIECKALINQLRRIYGTEPEGCQFFILENHHEFGIYHEAAIYFNITDENNRQFLIDNGCDIQDIEPEENKSEIYAYECEQLPDKWDNEALNELRNEGHSQHQPAKVIKMKAA